MSRSSNALSLLTGNPKDFPSSLYKIRHSRYLLCSILNFREFTGNTMLLSLVLLAMIIESWTVSAQCDRSTILKFSVSSWRNESGHRLVAADVLSDVSDKDGVYMTVELLSEKCGDSRAVVLKTLSSAGQHEEQASVSYNVPPTQPEEQTSVSSTVAPTVLPLPGYRHFPGFGYYKKLPCQMTWKDGVEACRKEGTRMLLVESQEEIDTVYGWSGCCPWVGVHRESSSGPWINVLGQKMNSTDFFGWIQNYPNDQDNCVILNSSSRRGTSNKACDARKDVICEQML
ncbi:uncharacterized protein [Anabrus simplex]|uniref:uncharacterized protein n=1 Tax=Anabrus simplex TaxID=316456 RepID=UPI0035A34E05